MDRDDGETKQFCYLNYARSLSEFEVHTTLGPMRRMRGGRKIKRAGRPMPSNLSFGRQIAGRVSLSSDAARLSGRCLS